MLSSRGGYLPYSQMLDYTKTIEIRLEWRCPQKCFLIWNYCVCCLWTPLLVLTQSKETVSWSNLVFFYNESKILTILFAVKYEKITLFDEFLMLLGPIISRFIACSNEGKSVLALVLSLWLKHQIKLPVTICVPGALISGKRLVVYNIWSLFSFLLTLSQNKQ